MLRKAFWLIFAAFLSFSIVSCDGDDDDDDANEFPPLDRGNIEVDAYQLYLTDLTTNQIDTFGFGSKSVSGNSYDTVQWSILINSLRKYDVAIHYFKDGIDVTSNLKASGTRYINCFREFDTRDLRLDERSVDNNSNILGLDSEWSVDNNVNTPGVGDLKITLNYQSLAKNNLCDPGVRLFEATVPYKINR